MAVVVFGFGFEGVFCGQGAVEIGVLVAMLPEGVFRGPVELSYKVLAVKEAVGGSF